MSAPQTMRALVEDQSGTSASIQNVSVPTLEANDVLVKVAYVAQNPTDWKHASIPGLSVPGSIIGCDFSGTIVSLGPNLANKSLAVGQKIAGVVHGGKFSTKGSFAEYLRVQSDLVWALPENESIDLRVASTFGVPYITAAQVLYKRQEIPLPPYKVEGEQWYLVYGGSTSVGMIIIQLAKLAGFKVVATASPKNFDLVKSFGADAVVDYKDGPAATAEIKKITGNTLQLGLDTISEHGSFDISLNAFADSTHAAGKRQLGCLLSPSKEDAALAQKLNVKCEVSLAYSLMGISFEFLPGFTLPVIPGDREFYVELLKQTPELLTKNKIKANPITDNGTLDSITEGFEFQKSGKVSATKLVYKIEA